MRIRLQRYNVTVQYRPGKDIPVADSLSRSRACEEDPLDEDLGLEVFVEVILKEMAVSDEKMKEIRDITEKDVELQQLRRCVKHGWPETWKETPVLSAALLELS